MALYSNGTIVRPAWSGLAQDGVSVFDWNGQLSAQAWVANATGTPTNSQPTFNPLTSAFVVRTAPGGTWYTVVIWNIRLLSLGVLYFPESELTLGSVGGVSLLNIANAYPDPRSASAGAAILNLVSTRQ